MIDEKKIIARLRSRINSYINEHPDKERSEQVEIINEFIHLLQNEAKEEENGI